MESKFHLLADHLPDLILAAKTDGKITYINKACADFFCTKQLSEWTSYVHPDERNLAIENWNLALELGKEYEQELRLKRKSDHTYRWHHLKFLNLENSSCDGTMWGLTFTDITDRREIEDQMHIAKVQAEQASTLKTSFLANMSHELRTPLGAILGFIDLLQNTKDVKERDQYLEVIRRNGKSLAKIIDDILDLSKIEAGNLDVELVPFSLREILEEILYLFHSKVRTKGIYLNLEMDPNMPDEFVSDPSRFRQILLNIIGNAVKFTSTGGVSVSARALTGTLKDDRLRIQIDVRDTGPGLTREQVSRLFKPFTQAQTSYDRLFGGAGLGLALSRRLAYALGGNITVEDCEVGKGCLFRVEIAADSISSMPTSANMEATGESVENSVARLKGLNILVVDDSDDNRTLISTYLQSEGALVELASDGAEAVSKALDHPFDVILMDIQMPGMDGRKATKVLRHQEYSRPVIACTAHSMREEVELSLATGFDDHVTKPVNFEALISSLLKQTKERNHFNSAVRSG